MDSLMMIVVAIIHRGGVADGNQAVGRADWEHELQGQ
jgi:hypothetical protein